VLTGGTFFAQGLAVIALPVLTRLYSPSDFNLLAIYSSLIGLMAVAASLRFNVAVALPERDEVAMDLLRLSMLSAAVLATLVGIVVWLIPGKLVEMLGSPGFEPYLWMLPVGLFLASAYDAAQYWATRRKQFVLITKTRLTRAVGGVGCQLSLSGVTPSAWGLIFGQMVYGGLGLVGILASIWRQEGALFRRLDTARLVQTAKDYRRYPLVSVPEALMNTAANELPVILIATAAVGPEAGFLMLSLRVLGLPMALVGSSVGQVFLAEAPSRFLDGTIQSFTQKTMWRLAKVGAVPLLLIGAAAPAILPIVFGSEWSRTGELVAWLTPWFVFQFVSSPVSMVLHVTGQLLTAMCIQLFGLILRVGGVVLALRFSPAAVTEVFAVLSAVFYASIIPIILWRLHRASGRWPQAGDRGRHRVKT
jgi:O-antigen/teichoic acid export membrane protein